MPDRSYYAANRDRLLAETRAWKAAHPERAREHNRNVARRAVEKQQLIAKRRARGRARYAERCSQELERARRFRRDHADKVGEYRKRFAERHPERAVNQSRRASERWRDSNAAAVREKQSLAARQRRAQDPDEFRRWYLSNLERQRERGREASRRRSRLKQLGLPPRRVQRTLAADRRANDRAETEFFGRRRRAAEVVQIRGEARVHFRRATPAQLEALRARQRIMSRDELFTAGQALQERLRAAKARDLARKFLPEVARRLARVRGDALCREIKQDSIARQYRRLDPYVLEDEFPMRLRREAIELALALARLSADDEEMRGHVERRLPLSRARSSVTARTDPPQSASARQSHNARAFEPAASAESSRRLYGQPRRL